MLVRDSSVSGISFKKEAEMQTGQTTQTSDLIFRSQGLVRSIAWKIHQRLPSSVDLDDLIGFGQIGLAEAARDFDNNRNVQFTTYAYYRVRGAILDGLSTMSWFSKADYNRGRYELAANDVLESCPDRDDATWFGKTARILSMSYLMSRSGGESSALEPEVIDSPSEAAEVAELKEVMHRLIEELPTQEKAILKSVYFDGQSIKAAGEIIGISKPWASRLHGRALDSLFLKMTEPSSEMGE